MGEAGLVGWLLGCEACLACLSPGDEAESLVLGSRCVGEGRQTGRAGGGPAWLNLGSAGRDWVDAADRGRRGRAHARCFAVRRLRLDPCVRCVVNGGRCE
jgi:hypothetical protein